MTSRALYIDVACLQSGRASANFRPDESPHSAHFCTFSLVWILYVLLERRLDQMTSYNSYILNKSSSMLLSIQAVSSLGLAWIGNTQLSTAPVCWTERSLSLNSAQKDFERLLFGCFAEYQLYAKLLGTSVSQQDRWHWDQIPSPLSIVIQAQVTQNRMSKTC